MRWFINQNSELIVEIGHDNLRHDFQVHAIANTGAHACVGSTELLHKMCLKPSDLNAVHSLALIDSLTSDSLTFLGSYNCYIRLGDKISKQDIYFINSYLALTEAMLHLSLSACRELGLVHHKFPNHVHQYKLRRSSRLSKKLTI